MVKMSRYEKERALIILIVSACIFALIAFFIIKRLDMKKSKYKTIKPVKERVEEVRSFYSVKYKSDVIVVNKSLKDLSNVRLYKDTTKLGFYIEEEPIITLEIGVVERDIKPFEVIVFPDKIIELHK
nr:MAG TPA: hypothetical protein [Caudoviricetes sp.]DAU69277.1 MAG TPA: hypothetical protein [Bacteriophage sp.]